LRLSEPEAITGLVILLEKWSGSQHWSESILMSVYNGWIKTSEFF
jgi:hypothetical protein